MKDNGLDSRLLEVRTLLVTGEVDEELVEKVSTRLLVLDAATNNSIRVIITSPGGHVDCAFAIHDLMKYILSPVSCIGVGWVGSVAVTFLFGADKERRFTLPNTRFLLHQPTGGLEGHAPDIRIEAEEILKARERLNDLLVKETGQSVEKIHADSDRNYWMSAEEAVEYGLISRIVKTAADMS